MTAGFLTSPPPKEPFKERLAVEAAGAEEEEEEEAEEAGGLVVSVLGGQEEDVGLEDKIRGEVGIGEGRGGKLHGVKAGEEQ